MRVYRYPRDLSSFYNDPSIEELLPMTGTVHLVPSVLPMNGIKLSPPIPVRIMRKRPGLELGTNYYIGYVLPAGECLLYRDITLSNHVGAGRVLMGDLVELVTEIRDEAERSTPGANK